MNRTQRFPIFYGWRIVMACAVIGILVSSARLSFTIFLPTLLEDLGWSRTALGFGYTFGAWAGSCTALLAGILVDRYGPRLIMVTGGFLILLGLLFTSRMTEVWHFYLSFSLLVAMGSSMAHGVPAVSTVRKWFNQKAGLAVALTSIGGTFGLALITFLAPGLIQAMGWRKSWFYLGLVVGILIMTIAGLIVRKDPESMGLKPYGDNHPGSPVGHDLIQTAIPISDDASWPFKEAVKTRSFFCLAAANSLLLLSMEGSLGHMAAWGMDITNRIGLSPEQGMVFLKPAISLMAVSAMVGAMVGGPLSDRLGRRPVFFAGMSGYGLSLVFSYLISTALPSLWWLLVNASLGGFVFGLTMPLWTPYMGDLFGRASLGAIMGLSAFASGIFGGGGPVLFGWIYDQTGSYAPAFGLSAISAFSALILIGLVRKEEKRSSIFGSAP